MSEASGPRMRGFASMDKQRQRAIASKGGKAAHEKGTAHEFDSQEAALAAKRGHERGTAHEFTSAEARVAGRKGGYARKMRRYSPDGVAAQEPISEPAGETSGNEAVIQMDVNVNMNETGNGQPERSTAVSHNGHTVAQT